jgi:hypothetical protein
MCWEKLTSQNELAIITRSNGFGAGCREIIDYEWGVIFPRAESRSTHEPDNLV